ncbi:alpha/beta hydrolase [Eudoraea sp.]|uniref:alpha/beta hydrolase n=1 Tax=Eudoraea sp. TaxID=1979955 RepID=UPI003C7641B2
MPISKIPVYFMPGMATGPSIFKNIQLSNDVFECYYLEWFMPSKQMSLLDYAKIMSKQIVKKNPVLIGVSLGGLLVQEITNYVEVRKLIIISSVKNEYELPKRMLFARYTKAHRILPTGIVNNIELLVKYAFGETVSKRLELYEQYLTIRDKAYLDWCIDKIVNWKRKESLPNIIHIQGEKDPVFPVKYIKDHIEVKNGTHAMIIYRFKWFNERLPTIILS